MSLFKMKRGQESKVSSLTKEDGSLIFSLNGANDSTVRLDQTVNGTVQRLGIAVDKAKDADGVIDYNEPTRHIKIGYSGAGLSTSNLSYIAGYTNNGTQIKDVSKDVLKNWLGASDSANKLNPTVTLTSDGSNTTGYRLIATISLNAWNNYRAVFISRSRHQGAGYLTITVGNNSNSITYDNVYSEVTYWGPVNSGSVIAFDSYQVRVSSDGKKAYVFWKYWDYSSTDIYVISSDFTISNGTWMTSIAEATYGKVKAYTSINNAQSLQGSSLSQILNAVGNGNAFTGLDTTTNNKIKLTRANGGTVEKTINNVSNASSASFASTATLTAYPQGFDSRTTSATWGNTTGTFLTDWHTSSGGDIAFMDNNPSSGKVSMKLDGYFYQNEGVNRVLDTSDAANYVKKSGDTMTGALNFANGTWNKVGDDVKIGDHNIAGSLGVIGVNGQTCIDWCQYDNASKYQGIVYDGIKLATSGTFKADYFEGTIANATSAKNASHLGGKPSSDYALKADLSGDINALSAKRLPSYQSISVANSFFYRYGTAGNTSDGGAWTGFPSATLYNAASTVNGFGNALFQKKVGVLHLAAGSSAHDLVFQAGGTNGGIAYVATGRNPAYILDTLNYKDKAYTFNKLTASSTFTATSGVVIDGGSY